jgi:solute carrier family 13 (sodium-dependent dicarboxylate transporter), member 2/3/5
MCGIIPHLPVTETYSPAEERFTRQRQTFGLIAGPVLAVVVLLLPIQGLAIAAHRVAAVLVLMIVLWMTEALPLAVTALLGPTLCVLVGVASAQTAFAPFADPVIFLFIGSFMLAQAMVVHRLDRRLAFTALASAWVGSSGLRLVVAYASVTCFLSMWMSNTATTAMMCPLGLAVLSELGRERKGDPQFPRYAMAMMLVTSFAATIGGMGTPVGTPPNLIGVGLLRTTAGINVSFAGWMMMCVPMVIAAMALVIAYLLIPGARGIVLSPEAVRTVADQLHRLGSLTVGERNVLLAFAVTFLLWVLPGAFGVALGGDHAFTRRLMTLVPESVAAIVGALLLFLIPVSWGERRFTLSWSEASRIDWGIVLLFGGGLAMGRLSESTGLSSAMGHGVAAQFPNVGSVGLTVVFTALAVVMSETASNTAAANIVVPTAIAVAKAAGVSPLEPAMGATLGASLGFMMPISTPPNAIVYSSGYIPIGAMVRNGIVLDIVGYFIVIAGVLGLSALI